jgi:hypothetical protein
MFNAATAKNHPDLHACSSSTSAMSSTCATSPPINQ